MTLKIRLRKQGRTNRPFFRLVVTESRTRRDGKYIEALGWYNPVEQDAEKVFHVKADRIQHWLDHGAQLSESAEALLNKGAPEVLKRQTEKKLAHLAKVATKRKVRKKAAA